MRLGDYDVHGFDIERTARRVDTIAHAHSRCNRQPGKLGYDDGVDGRFIEQPKTILRSRGLNESDFPLFHPIASAFVEIVGRPPLGAAERLSHDLFVPLKIEEPSLRTNSTVMLS